MGAVNGVPVNPATELIACLEVLSTYIDETPTDDPVFTDSEFFTAVWETVDLTFALLRQYNELLALMDAVMAEREAGQRASKLVVANAGDARRLIREMGR